ncbi:regulatory protein GemA [Methylococcus capsulatus]|uniref:regulatory protein GemA n=1 Tax=Methylococcus capsulatus TaxID=414 RepID=UPI003CE9BEA1
MSTRPAISAATSCPARIARTGSGCASSNCVGRGATSRTVDQEAQSRKIRALWLGLHQAGIVRDPNESALAAYVKRMTGVEALQWLDEHQASRVIEQLKKWGFRAARQAEDRADSEGPRAQ